MINWRMAPASASASRGGTSNPVTPLITKSRQPGTSQVTTGNSIAAASAITFDPPSRYEGRTSIDAFSISSRTSARWPNSVTPGIARNFSSSASESDEGFPGSGAPTIEAVTRIPRCRRISRARISSRQPFSCSNRPTNKTWLAFRSGTALGRKRCTSTPEVGIKWSRDPASARVRGSASIVKSSLFWKIT
jgi:hypothetical protein